ncbi:MAG: hypothetical protein ACI8Q9_001689 [Planctomycetota bacterium]
MIYCCLSYARINMKDATSKVDGMHSFRNDHADNQCARASRLLARIPIVMLALLMAFTRACANQGEPRDAQEPGPSHSTLIGQVLLPGGFARRGVELHVTSVRSGGEALNRWVQFDNQGSFSHTVEGQLTGVMVSAGSRPDLFRLGTEELAEARRGSPIDVGTIDLRDRLMQHRLVVHAAEGTRLGEVRVAMIFEPPAVGPQGGSVSLGSKQFPPVALGNVQEWLLPLDAESVYFLVERPAEVPTRTGWSSGKQRLFGPFTLPDLPTELVMD